MAIKLFRTFMRGSYAVNPQKLHELNVTTIPKNFALITSLNDNQGLGRIKGTTKKLGNNYSPVLVCCFKRSNRQLLWETTSKPDGSYEFRNIAKGLECFVVAFDPNEEYNAVISDKVVAK